MTTTIYNNDGKAVATSKNLRAILRGASAYGGVRRIMVSAVTMTHDGRPATPGGAEVAVYYLNGFVGKTEFVSHAHAVDWAFERSHIRPRTSYFAGCDVYAPDAELTPFERAYIGAALWSSNASNGNPLDDYFDAYDLDADTRARMVSDCRDFQHEQRELLKKAYPLYREKLGMEYTPDERAGHDFWLTRNGHGAGFWDRGLGKVGDQLSEAAKLAGSHDIDEYNMTEQARIAADITTEEE
jgi:hypothetical protein